MCRSGSEKVQEDFAAISAAFINFDKDCCLRYAYGCTSAYPICAKDSK